MCFKSKSGRRIHIISWGNGWFSILFRVKQLLNSVIPFDIGDFPWLCFNYQRAKVQFLSVVAPHDLVDVREETPTVKILQLLDPCWTFCEIVSTTRALQVAQMFCHSVTPSRRCPSGKWMAGKVSGQWLEMYIFGVFSKSANPPGKPNGIPLICGSTFGEWYVDNPQFVSVLQILYLISHRGLIRGSHSSRFSNSNALLRNVWMLRPRRRLCARAGLPLWPQSSVSKLRQVQSGCTKCHLWGKIRGGAEAIWTLDQLLGGWMGMVDMGQDMSIQWIDGDLMVFWQYAKPRILLGDRGPCDSTHV